MKQLDSKTRQLITDPIKRRAWVKYQVHLQGRSLAQVAAAAGVTRTTLYQTFMRPYPRMEKIIADAVGLTPQVLFPERYDADGLPNRMMGRPRKKSTHSQAQDSSRDGRRNVSPQRSGRREAA